jgi:hypothetical protein
MTPVILIAVAACGGSPGAAGPSDAAPTADASVRNFMQAVADSNIVRMGRYWGTSRGPATVTHQPADYVQRLGITQAFLRRSPFKVLRADADPADTKKEKVVVEFTRTDLDGKTCARVATFTALNTEKYGWIVSGLDLNEVGTPGRACLSAPKTGP